MTRSFDVFSALHLNRRLSKQSWCWWIEAPWPSLWRHCNVFSVWIPIRHQILPFPDHMNYTTLHYAALFLRYATTINCVTWRCILLHCVYLNWRKATFRFKKSSYNMIQENLNLWTDGFATHLMPVYSLLVALLRCFHFVIIVFCSVIFCFYFFTVFYLSVFSPRYHFITMTS